MSQHVPMSPRARTAADIIIVYSIRPWVSGRHCASPPLVCSKTFLGEGGLCVNAARGTRVLRGVSSPRSVSVDTATVCGCCCVRYALPNDDNTLPLQATGPAATQDFGERRANAWIETRAALPPQRRGHCNFFGVVSCWQNVSFCECLLGMASFQCIGGGSVPPPISCGTQGRAVRRKARRLALAEA